MSTTAFSGTHIRPLMNNDSTNSYPGPFGKPRPIKHWRRGRMFVNPEYASASVALERVAQSSNGSGIPLGGSHWTPGVLHTSKSECDECVGTSWTTDLKQVESEIPNKSGCCTQNRNSNYDRKARRKTLAANTVITKQTDYFQTNLARLRSRCRTFQQNQFNFEVKEDEEGEESYYVAQCSNPYAQCTRVYYKPNNAKYSQQGAVSSSARITALKVGAIGGS
jgi:hypothetical protein